MIDEAGKSVGSGLEVSLENTMEHVEFGWLDVTSDVSGIIRLAALPRGTWGIRAWRVRESGVMDEVQFRSTIAEHPSVEPLLFVVLDPTDETEISDDAR